MLGGRGPTIVGAERQEKVTAPGIEPTSSASHSKRQTTTLIPRLVVDVCCARRSGADGRRTIVDSRESRFSQRTVAKRHRVFRCGRPTPGLSHCGLAFFATDDPRLDCRIVVWRFSHQTTSSRTIVYGCKRCPPGRHPRVRSLNCFTGCCRSWVGVELPKVEETCCMKIHFSIENTRFSIRA